ncbi:hypothetical protein E4U58_000487 [Claviceps cyperi]|nr:hypothetical protein E4U58_000487 [Claviceps cyperi]
MAVAALRSSLRKRLEVWRNPISSTAADDDAVRHGAITLFRNKSTMPRGTATAQQSSADFPHAEQLVWRGNPQKVTKRTRIEEK